MRGYHINARTDEHGEIDVEQKLEEYYKLLECDCIDIITREINGRAINIICDDEGLLKENRIAAWAFKTNERLAGSLLVFGNDNETGNLRSLTDAEVSLIDSRVVLGLFQDGSEHPVLWYSR